MPSVAEQPPVAPPVPEVDDQDSRATRNRSRRQSTVGFHAGGIFAAVVVRSFTADNETWVGQNLAAILVYVAITGGFFINMLWND